MERDKFIISSRRGAIMVMTAVGAIFLLGLLAMVTDVGWMYYNQKRLQTAVNAGFKAGMDKLRQIKSTKYGSLSAEDKNKIRQRVIDVMHESGLSAHELSLIPPTISYLENDSEIRVNATQSVGLFFARVMDFQNATVAAKRETLSGFGAPLAPFGLPLGPVKDPPVASGLPFVELFAQPDPVTGQYDPNATYFATNSEYILKPGGDNVPVGTSSMVKVFIPMVLQGTTSGKDPNGQVEDNSGDYTDSNPFANDTFLKSYGMAFWCLRRDQADPGYLPVQWLLGYKKGSFMLPFDLDCKVVKKAKALGIGFRILIQTSDPGTVTYVQNVVTAAGVTGVSYETGPTVIDDIYDATNQTGSGVLELKDDHGFRPKVAVYSSQTQTDPVEAALRAAQIPYGTYNPGRNDSYVRTSNTTIYDNDILNGALDNYQWIHCHHEDFTGMTGGCQEIEDSCYDKRSWLSLSSVASTQLCAYCRCYYFPVGSGSTTITNVSSGRNSWGSTYSGGGSKLRKSVRARFNGTTQTKYLYWDPTRCDNYGQRCADRRTWDDSWYIDIFPTSIVSGQTQSRNLCTTGDYERPTCQSFKQAWDTATSHGFTDYPVGACARDLRRKCAIGSNLVSDSSSASPMYSLPSENDFVRYPHRVQRMKYYIVRLIRKHLLDGGHLFSECFAPETLDMALWQGKVYERLRGGADSDIRPPGYTTNSGDYADCLAGQNFVNKLWFRVPGSGGVYASSLNINSSVSFDPFALFPRDPRCQTHDSSCSAGSGHTDGFDSRLLKSEITNLHAVSSYQVGYLKGTLSDQGTFAFFGGHAPKDCGTRRLILDNVLLGAFSTKQVTGQAGFTQRVNYGRLDLDNDTSTSGSTDYLNRFKYGYNDPIQFDDRIIPESGNEATATVDGLGYRINGDTTASPSRFVIVPVIDLPPEVKAQNPTASSVYDLPANIDNPNGVYSPASYAFQTSIRIIGFALFELLDPSEYTRVGTDFMTGDMGNLGPALTGQVRGKFVQWIIKPGELPLQ